MTVQTTYSIDHAADYPGMVDSLEPMTTISKLNKGTATILSGKGVVTDGENGAKLPDAASTPAEFNGIVMRELNRATPDGIPQGANPGQDFTVISHGYNIRVVTADIVVKDDPVFLRVGSTGTGDFSNVAGTGATLSIAIPGAKFLTGGNALAVVKISLGTGG